MRSLGVCAQSLPKPREVKEWAGLRHTCTHRATWLAVLGEPGGPRPKRVSPL